MRRLMGRMARVTALPDWGLAARYWLCGQPDLRRIHRRRHTSKSLDRVIRRDPSPDAGDVDLTRQRPIP